MSRGGFGGFGGGNMSNIMKQAQKMQQDLLEKMERLGEELAERTVESTVGGGAVTVTATCDLRIKAIKIKPEAVDPDDVEMLEDLVTAAANESLRKADEIAKSEREKVTGPMGGAGGMGGLGALF